MNTAIFRFFFYFNA
ncbi:pheST operon leader peptide PheM [Pectobacterium betavasculorum]|nr:pheST operon leader peptide PheM [Pectobacterium betavasculorum]